jgi:anti-sigma B factor antagonist
MELNVRSINNVDIIDIQGRIDMDQERRLRDLAVKLMNEGSINLIFNFNECDYLCSPALGTIAISIKGCREKGGDVRLLNVNDYLLNIFEITKLTQIVDVHDDEEKCLSLFK